MPSAGGNGSPFDFDQQQPAVRAAAQAPVAEENSEAVESHASESNNDANGLAELFDSFWAYKVAWGHD